MLMKIHINKSFIIPCMILACTACSKEPTSAEAEKSTVKPNQQTQPSNLNAMTANEAKPAEAITSNLSAQQSGLSANSSEFNIEVRLNSDVLFDFGKATLKPQANTELDKVAEIIRTKGKGVISITGYTDNIGSNEANQELSLQRAESVKQYFVSQNLAFDYQIEGLGETHPIAPNEKADGSDNPEGRQKNRRVEIVINKTQNLREHQQ